MKRAWIGILILVIVVGAGVGDLVPNKGAGASAGSGDLAFAKVEPLTIAIGGYQLSTVDLGDGPVPLLQIPLDTWAATRPSSRPTAASSRAKTRSSIRKANSQSRSSARKTPRPSSRATRPAGGQSSGPPWTASPRSTTPSCSDKGVAPKALGLFDWSTGGDGILVRNSMHQDLKDKIVLTSSNTPYSFFLLLGRRRERTHGQGRQGRLGGRRRQGAEALQRRDTRIAAWVSWTPFINDVVDSKSPSFVPDTRLLISSKDANQLIADVYIVRSDLLQDKPEMMQAFLEANTAGGLAGDRQFDLQRHGRLLQAGLRGRCQVHAGRRPRRELPGEQDVLRRGQ